jgi:soluble lytic murein transglycosylase-like protein/outer membrane protein assembly factor BamD (BamD/ComL family)
MLASWLLLLTAVVETPFVSNVDRAVSHVQSRDWREADAALSKAWADDPSAFDANNLHYLWGRTAEELQDWARALEGFSRIDSKNPLRPLAAWHAARAAMKLGAFDQAAQFIDELPADFPAELKLRLAREATPALSLRLVRNLNTREAKLRRALLLEDSKALWQLLREDKVDDVSLALVGILAQSASTSRDKRDVGMAFLAQRLFKDAEGVFERLKEDAEFAPEAEYQIARARFLSGDYEAAADRYKAITEKFPGTSWAREASYQVGLSYWRARRHKDAESALLRYIEQEKARKGKPEAAIRDLVDVYRSLEEPAKAITLIDRTLAGKVAASTRQVLLFSKAKIRFSEGKYADALKLVRQLKRLKLQNVAGGTSAEELQYFEALCLSKTGSTEAARTIWRKLAANSLSYYGQRAALQLGMKKAGGQESRCTQTSDLAASIRMRLDGRRRAPLADGAMPKDAVTELVYFGLWDEASLWLDRARRPDSALAADLGYVSARYERAILFADRLPQSAPDVRSLRYPAAYQQEICSAASRHSVDPLWLHAVIWQESKYNAGAQSAAPARGLTQFIPDTAQTVAARIGLAELPIEKLYDPKVSIELGAAYWSELMGEFGNAEFALAAYNGGPDNVRRWRDKWPKGDPDFFVFDIGFTETKRYVQAVFGAYAGYARGE